MFPVELRSERLVLRDVEPADAAAIWRAHAEGGGFFPPGTATDEPATLAWIERTRAAASSDDRAQYRLAVTLRETGELIGSARVHVEAPYDHSGSIGWSLLPLFRGRGYATEAAARTLDFAFGELALHRIEATIQPDNEPSIALAVRLGMRLEGRMVQRFRTPAGWADALLYAITEDEWRARG